jgi:hypothetical protein
LLLLF